MDMKIPEKIVEPGKFIAFEGIDGCGKSTQIQLLMQKLKSADIKCYQTKEPTNGPVGSLIHQFMTGRIKADEKVIAAMFAADRLDHLLNTTDGILAKINGGVTVVTDRYYLSSYAYHSDALTLNQVIAFNAVSADALKPTCHIFIDIDPKVSYERVTKGRFHTELYETYEKLSQVRKKYFEAIDILKDTENVIIVNGDQSEAKLAEDIWNKVSVLL